MFLNSLIYLGYEVLKKGLSSTKLVKLVAGLTHVCVYNHRQWPEAGDPDHGVSCGQ
jgi:hypothetical protein